MLLKDATLLVVDDEPYYCEIAQDWFQREGCRVFTAEDGIVALKLLENENANAIITDIRMPRMDGVELIKQLKARGRYTPAAVALSGFSDLPPREAYDLGIEAQLSKPVTRKVLIAAVQTVLTDRMQLWGGPAPVFGGPSITAAFASLQSAREQRLIAFGRGGFCLQSELMIADDTRVNFDVSFQSEQQVVRGQGTLRWTSPEEHCIGIEIARVQDGLEQIVHLCGQNSSLSFIPRST